MRCCSGPMTPGCLAGWVTGDEVYGQHFKLRGVEERGMSYVLAVPVNQHVIARPPVRRHEPGPTRCRRPPGQSGGPVGGRGAKGHRLYDWARVRINFPDRRTGCWPAAACPIRPTWPTTCARTPATSLANWSPWPEPAGPSRKPSRPRKAKSGWTTTRSGVHRLVPTHHPVHAGPRLPDRHPLEKGCPHTDSEYLVRLSLPEIRHLITRIAWHRATSNQQPGPGHIIRCSIWRRKPQHRAQQCHYKARGHAPQTRL